MSVSQPQITALLALPGEERFKHFIKVVVDREEAWGLYQNGWAMASTDDRTPVFPLWPRDIFASMCAVNDWENYEARPIALDELTDLLLPKLKEEGVLPEFSTLHLVKE